MTDRAENRASPGRTLAVLTLSALAYALAQTMIVPALPAIQHKYGASPTTATWLLTSFLLTSSVFTPLLGRLGDMYGKERLLMCALGAFGAGSLIAGLGGSIAVLIAGRAVQGAGGAIFPLAFGIIRDEFPRERVATSIGLISATFGIGGGGGLVLSGVLVDQVDVSWIFWLGLLGTVIALVATWRWVPESPVRVRARVDVVGAALLSTGLGALLLGVSEGNAWGWGSDRVLALFFGSLLVLVTFVRFELGRSQPLVDMRLMRARPVLTTNLAALAVGFAMFGSYVLIPQLVQTPSRAGYGFDASVTASGVFLLPSAFVMLFSGPLSGQLGARFGSRLPLGLGAVACGIASFGLAAAHADRIDIYLGGAVIGLGIGLAFAAMANLVVEAVSQDQTGVATGINTIMRAIGGALGAQIAAALLAAHSVLGGRYPAESGFTDAFLMSGCGALLALLATWAIPSRFAARAGRLAQIEG